MAEQQYDGSSIKTLTWNEHIRQRSGMYIGRLGNGDNQDDGIYILLKEVVDNAIDEFTMGFGKQVQITVEDGMVTVRDFGRGIPHENDSVIRCVSSLNTGGKFDDKNFKKSVGMNGVGTKAVNALSSYFYVESFRDGKSSWAQFERGNLVDSGMKENVSEKNGTFVKFKPDSQKFGDYTYNMDFVETMVKNYSFLKKGLTIVLNGTPYKSENGLLDLVNDRMSETPLYPPIHLEGEDIEIVLTHGNSYGENISSFVNGQNTREGGTHLAAFREAIAKTLKDFFKKDYDPQDCRQGVVGAISIQIQEPQFEGQTKTKLGSTYMWDKQIKDENGNTVNDKGPTIRSFVNDFVSRNLDDYLRIHKDIVPVIEEKIKSSKKEREEISGIQKKTREKNKRANVYNKKLRDCRYHYCDKVPKDKEEEKEKSSIFITEGDSASGTITKVRNANNQAVFSLRGKPINCYKESRKRVAENEELNLLISALGVEEDLNDLRYNNIIVATDADDDGMHIRMLVLTFFMKYYPDLIRRGHVHILQTPLFRVRNKKKKSALSKNKVKISDNAAGAAVLKKNRSEGRSEYETIYCYSDEERREAIRKLQPNPEITRFKGLGEIDSSEFKNFIGPDMRLDQVTLSKSDNVSEMLSYYMGKNTPERQKFIIDNLVVEEDKAEDLESE